MNATLTSINQREVLKYLGYTGGPMDPCVRSDIVALSQEVFDTATPLVTYKIFDIASHKPLHLTQSFFVPQGTDCARLLQDSFQCILFCATLGMPIEKLLRTRQVTDMYQSVILDCCASSAIENVCDNFQKELEASCQAKGLFLTDRFSPGYGDMPFAQQRNLCEVLDTAKTIGVCLNTNNIMIPRKSVTAVLGISRQPQTRRFRGCEYCSKFENCTYRKGGTDCGNT